MKLGTAFPCCQPGEHPGVARATRYAAAVGPLEQRNQVLARETEAVPQHGGGRPAQLAQRPLEGGAKLGERGPGGVALLVDLLHRTLPHQVRQQGPHRRARELPLQVGHPRDPPPGLRQAPPRPPPGPGPGPCPQRRRGPPPAGGGPGATGPGGRRRPRGGAPRPAPPSPASAANAARRPAGACSAAIRRWRSRGRGAGKGSSTTPPPIVVTGENDRSTKRSPPRATSGRSSTSRTRPRSPGPMERT